MAESCRNYYKEKKAERFRTRFATVLLTASLLFLLFSAGVGVQNLNGYNKIKEVGQTLEDVSENEQVLELYKETSSVSFEEESDILTENPDEEVITDETVIVEEEESTEGIKEPVSESSEEIVLEEERPETVITEKPTEDGDGEDVSSEELSTEDGGEVAKEEPEVVAEDEEGTETVVIAPEYITYEVSKGDTLYGICVRFYGNLSRASEICSINNIENKDNILYGQKILLPQ